jgi:hypothetical protein
MKPIINQVMKRNYFITVVTFSIFLIICLNLSAFSYSHISRTKETRNLDKFNDISLSIAAKVFIVQGSEYRFEIEADEDDLGKIETNVKNGKLEIKTKNWMSGLGGNITIHITLPELEGLSVSGSGSINSNSKFNCQDLDLAVTGSGVINMEDLAVHELNAMITGSGNIKLNGKPVAQELLLTITGSGNYSAEELKINEARITITGSGSAKVNVVQQLKTNITGSGNVLYKGDPMINANSTGSGRTKKM